MAPFVTVKLPCQCGSEEFRFTQGLRGREKQGFRAVCFSCFAELEFVVRPTVGLEGENLRLKRALHRAQRGEAMWRDLCNAAEAALPERGGG